MNINENTTIYYPQDEMNTFLLPVTTGCSYNKCAFCSMYKDEEYFEIALSQIKINLVSVDKNIERVFLTGADPMAIGFDKMMKILVLINRYLPYCACVASYASIKNIARYSLDELKTLHDAGLRLLYIGFETGSDDILKKMKKSHDVEEGIKQAKKLNEANLQFNTIIMYGIGGKGKYEENAIATANMINQFKTRKVITMNLIVFDETELMKMVKRGEFIPADQMERLLEIRVLLENIVPVNELIFDTTHPTNIIKIKGTLPKDKEMLLNQVGQYL
ncbi:MAG: radical SAM protein [Firmicutes bacterium]|nr:radical SAM protein [Bacillota bacterium]